MALPQWRQDYLDKIKEQEQQIATLQDELNSLKEQNRKLQEHVNELDATLIHPENETEYWRSEASYWKSVANSNYINFPDSKFLENIFDEKTRQILADNKNLLKSHDAIYWIGMTHSPFEDYKRKTDLESQELIRKNARLERRLNYLQNRNDHLDKVFSKCFSAQWEEGEQEDEYWALYNRCGRPKKIKNNSEAAEAIGYRQKGWPIREIAAKMDWSTGFTHKVVRDVEVTQAALQQHKKERKEAARKQSKTDTKE